jgi:hypothetical protein
MKNEPPSVVSPAPLSGASRATLEPRRRRPWRPLLTGEAAAAAQTVIEEIAAALRTRDLGLSCVDAAMHALFFAYLADTWPERGYSTFAEDYMDRATELLAESSLHWDLFGGIPVVAWVREHVWGRFDLPDEEDANETIDQALRSRLDVSPWNAHYDLVSGLAGLGVYALERLPRAISVECLELIVERLYEECEPTVGGVAWLSKPELMPDHRREECPEGHYNVGVAHGIPAVIAVLAGARAAGVSVEHASLLYNGSVTWLLSQRLGPDSPSQSTYWITTGASPPPARAAWCYGDPGVAATLYAAASLVEDNELAKAAVEMGRLAATRPMGDCGVWDAGLCHGSAGLLQLFNRLWNDSGDEVFAVAARQWLDATMRLRAPGSGIAGFRTWYPQPWGERPAGWDENDRSLLSGAIGVGLALLGAISTVEPAWDRLLLASLPPR